ncbi:GATA transcription factor 4-like [Prosopis cineraria]|uniref:GATA transcription factor 4-like n=1 Tax=Prosopis cineraria TaxID=364024 RepID=UPI00240F4ED7|nr:GATA transcription factor 4-like [Prosopis cineraria]
MTVGEDCFDFTDLHDPGDSSILPSLHEVSESQLCVPPDSLEGLEWEWFPSFSEDFISWNQKGSFCVGSDQPCTYELVENGAVNEDWVRIYGDAVSSFTKKKKRSRKRTTPRSVGMDSKRCSHCETEETPQWRYGPEGPKTLCNACGMRFKSGRLPPEYHPAASPTFNSCKHPNYHRKIMERRGFNC